MQSRWLLGWCLCFLDITLAWSATFKIALLGPWSCDPMFSRAMPTAAANLALSRIQSDSSLSRGYHYSVKLLEEDCSLSRGAEARKAYPLFPTNHQLLHLSPLVSFSSEGSGRHGGLRPGLHRPLQPHALQRRRVVRSALGGGARLSRLPGRRLAESASHHATHQGPLHGSALLRLGARGRHLRWGVLVVDGDAAKAV